MIEYTIHAFIISVTLLFLGSWALLFFGFQYLARSDKTSALKSLWQALLPNLAGISIFSLMILVTPPYSNDGSHDTNLPVFFGAYAIALFLILAITKALLPLSFKKILLPCLPSVAFLIFAGIPLFTAIHLPSLTRIRVTPYPILSASNLRGIGIALCLYSSSNDNAYPPRLDYVVNTGYASTKMLHYPRDPNRRYFYYRPTKDTPQTALVACEPRPSYEDKRWVLLMSGAVEQATEPEFQQLLTRPENKAFAGAWREARGNEKSAQAEAKVPARPKGDS